MKLFRSLFALAAFAAIATATTVIPMSLDQISAASTHVLVGRAGDSWSAWDAEHKIIYTYTKFTVSRALKGEAQSVVIKQLGGSADHFQQKVAGVRYFAPGEEAVVFVHPSQADDGTVVITGLMQGNFHVSNVNGEIMASNGLTGVESLDEQSHVVTRYSGTRLPLRELERRVREGAK